MNMNTEIPEGMPGAATVDPNSNDVLIDLPNTKRDPEDYTIPHLTMRAILLFEKINSPFIRERPQKFNPATGEPMTELVPVVHPVTKAPILDDQDAPVMEPQPIFETVTPTMLEVAQAFYVLLNQERPDILMQVQDAQLFEQIVFEFAATLTPEALGKIMVNINMEMMRLNSISADDGDISSKKATGPTPTSEGSLKPTAAVPAQSSSG